MHLRLLTFSQLYFFSCCNRRHNRINLAVMEQGGEPFHVNEITSNLEPESSTTEGANLMLRLSECFHHIAFLENQNDFLRLKLKLTIKHCLDNVRRKNLFVIFFCLVSNFNVAFSSPEHKRFTRKRWLQ